MDRWIRTAWRAFWVGLGASAVLIGQTVLMPAPRPVAPADHADPAAAPLVAPASAPPPAVARVASYRTKRLLTARVNAN
jgi:hypothetical protein